MIRLPSIKPGHSASPPHFQFIFCYFLYEKDIYRFKVQSENMKLILLLSFTIAMVACLNSNSDSEQFISSESKDVDSHEEFINDESDSIFDSEDSSEGLPRQKFRAHDSLSSSDSSDQSDDFDMRSDSSEQFE
ncbi:unnamed protein product [Caenorhabditis brenneri]